MGFNSGFKGLNAHFCRNTLDFKSSSVHKKEGLSFFNRRMSKSLNKNADRCLVSALEGTCQNLSELRANSLCDSQRTAVDCCGKNKPRASSSYDGSTIPF